MAVTTSTMTAAKGIASMGLAARKASGQIPALQVHLTPGDFLTVFGLAAVLILGYFISLWLFPHTLCRRCGGSGKVGGGLLAWGGWSACRRCRGTGLKPRLGTLLMGR
jgi:hypothetical protein